MTMNIITVIHDTYSSSLASSCAVELRGVCLCMCLCMCLLHYQQQPNAVNIFNVHKHPHNNAHAYTHVQLCTCAHETCICTYMMLCTPSHTGNRSWKKTSSVMDAPRLSHWQSVRSSTHTAHRQSIPQC